MPLELSLATEADIPAIVRSQMSAFHPIDPIHQLIYPSPTPVPSSALDTIISRQLTSWRANPSGARWVIVTDPSQPTDASGTSLIIAAAKWLFFSHEKEGEDRWPLQPEVNWLPPATSAEVYDSKGVNDQEYVEWILAQFYGGRRQFAHGPCAVLDICFTHPEWQKKGAGKLLVEWGTQEADRRGVPAWVEASIFGRGLYEKFGFGGEGCVYEEVRLGPWRKGEEGVGRSLRSVGREEGWRDEWTEKGYQGGGWTFMERKVREKGNAGVELRI